MLSGFLVGGLLFAELRRNGEVDARRFLVRRAFKIWPAYFIFLGFAFYRQSRFTGEFWPTLKTYIPNLIHLQNYYGSPEALTWSLAVEEHFYLFLPMALTFMGIARIHRFPAFVGGIALTCFGLRLLNLSRTFDFLTHFDPTHLRIDSLLCGVLLAYWFHFQREAFTDRVWRGRWSIHEISRCDFWQCQLDT